ncbi:MAG: sensor histidine kinase [Acidimicrobiia bacterium]
MSAVRTLAWATVVVVVAALLVAELAMDMTPGDRLLLYAVFGAMALVTALAAVAALRWAPRLRSLLTSLRIVAFAAVVVAAGAVAAAALTMFIEPHDLTLVMVALLLGVGLGGVLAVAVAGPLAADLGRLADTARAVGAGDRGRETGIERNDELGEAARAFDAMTRRLHEAEMEKQAAETERSALIAAVGHDLRTPLASLQSSLEAIEDGLAPDPQRYLRGMTSDVDHLRRLVEDLFLLARIDAGRHRVEPEPVDLAELVDEAVEAMGPMSAARGVSLRVETTGSVPSRADPAAVGRVLRNLVDNALRHSPTGGEVTLTVDSAAGEASVLVVDEGPGFPPDFHSMAFERFTRPDDSRSRAEGGAGLGLAIVAELTQLSGGRAEIAEGPGGRVQVWFPGI